MLTIDGRSDLALGTKHNSMEATMPGTINSAILPPKPARSPEPRYRHMWLVTGTAGCGKSTVASYLSEALSIPYIEGDDYHPPSNREKMTQGIPLSDMDRWDWLITLRDAAVATLSPSNKTATRPHDGVVVTCSALKRKYRDVIRVAAYNDHQVHVHFIFLHAPEDVLVKRVTARKGHFMGAKMVHSQFEVLEEPSKNECNMDVLSVDCSGEMDAVEKIALAQVRLALEDDESR